MISYCEKFGPNLLIKEVCVMLRLTPTIGRVGSVVSRTQDQRRNLIHWMKGLLMDSLTVNENDFNQILATTTTPCAN